MLSLTLSCELYTFTIRGMVTDKHKVVYNVTADPTPMTKAKSRDIDCNSHWEVLNFINTLTPGVFNQTILMKMLTRLRQLQNEFQYLATIDALNRLAGLDAKSPTESVVKRQLEESLLERKRVFAPKVKETA